MRVVARLAVESALDDEVVRLDMRLGGDMLDLLDADGARVVLVEAEVLDGAQREGGQRAQRHVGELEVLLVVVHAGGRVVL